MSDNLIKRSDVLSMIDAFERDFEQPWKVQFSADIRALPAVDLSDLINQPPDEEFITLTEVARDPVAAWMTIVDNAVRIEQLVEERDITRRLLGAATQMQTETQAKIDRAGIDALETILNERGPVFDAMVDAAENAAGTGVSFNVVVGDAIRTALAVLAIYTRTDKTSGPKY